MPAPIFRQNPTGSCAETSTTAPSFKCGNSASFCRSTASTSARSSSSTGVSWQTQTTSVSETAVTSDAEGESAGSETGPDQFSKPRLVEWRLALRQSRDPLRIEVHRNRRDPGRSRAGGGHRAEMPQAEDRELHVGCSKTQRFCASQSTVRNTPSRIVSFGFQPSARMRRVSRRMNGLSPIHPRSPPA